MQLSAPVEITAVHAAYLNKMMLANSNSKIDCAVRVITPENIEFEYMLAGPFQRLPAFMVDLVFRWIIFFAIVAIFTAFQVTGLLLNITGTSWLVWVAAILLYFAISWFYGIILETVFNGRTLGKMFFKLRVISVDGRPINASQAAMRNLLRSADMAPMLSLQLFGTDLPAAYVIPTMFLGLITAALTARMQRVGDLAARTMVIVDRSGRAPAVFQPEDARAYVLAELIPPTFQVNRTLSNVVGLYMETRRRFTPPRRSELASTLARPLIRQMGLSREISPDLLLCALYVRTFLSEEHRSQSAKIRERAPVSTMPPLPPGGIRRQSLPPSIVANQNHVPTKAVASSPSTHSSAK